MWIHKFGSVDAHAEIAGLRLRSFVRVRLFLVPRFFGFRAYCVRCRVIVFDCGNNTSGSPRSPTPQDDKV